jgi:hypothetical protein
VLSILENNSIQIAVAGIVSTLPIIALRFSSLTFGIANTEAFKTEMQISAIRNLFSSILKMDHDDNFDFKKLKLSRRKFTEMVGEEIIDPRDHFKNNILITAAVFHQNKMLNNILDNCDFSSDPQIAEKVLTYKDANGLNLLQHACRNSIAMGDKLVERIIDIYTKNLNKEILFKSIDKFILTLPENHLKKIVKVLGIETLKSILDQKFDENEIKNTISQYHSPNVLKKTKGMGYEKTTVANNVVMDEFYDNQDNIEQLKKSIKFGYGMQITSVVVEKLEKIGFSIAEFPNVYVTAGSHNGRLADTFTISKFNENSLKSARVRFTETSALKSFEKNLKSNMEFLLKKGTPDRTLQYPKGNAIKDKEPDKEL